METLDPTRAKTFIYQLEAASIVSGPLAAGADVALKTIDEPKLKISHWVGDLSSLIATLRALGC